jgi:hypothetical protein
MINADLFDSLAAIPRLPGALCRGRREDWDPDLTKADAQDPEQDAAAICLVCPALTLCRDWIDSLKPSQRPAGVVAALVVRHAS